MLETTSREAPAAVVGILSNYDDPTKAHSVFNAYLRCILEFPGVVALIVPCVAAFKPVDLDRCLEGILASIDGLLLPGSRSDVHPSVYGKGEHPASTIFDRARDRTALALIRAALVRAVPVLGICRGAHEMNCALGGSLHQSLDELPDVLDHKADASLPQALKYGPRHKLIVDRGSWLSPHIGGLSGEAAAVNSLHRQGIDRLGDGLRVDAVSSDGVIEAFSVENSPAIAFGVQWHPEWHTDDVPNSLVMSRFIDACRARAVEGRAARLVHCRA
jgi:putative glutamine amidotransferase